MIQEHHARSLHWDLRLERGGVLVSWALPKGTARDPRTQNHLAVHTEDHPLEYATFEGEIPKGEYGGGRVTIWDTGPYDVEKWTDTEVKFVLHGTRVDGSFVLFQTKDRNWMIHRHGPSTRADPLPTLHQAHARHRGTAAGRRRRLGLRDQVGRRAHHPLRGGRTRPGTEPQRPRRHRQRFPSWPTSASSSG